MGKAGLKDYTKEQGFSHAEAANVIKNGKGKMKEYKRQAVRCRRKSVGCRYVRSLTAGSGSACGLATVRDQRIFLSPAAIRSMT